MNNESSTLGDALSQARVSAKHHYRFRYLKSEHWSNLRIAKLAAEDAKCRKCGYRDLSNDIHHLLYRRLYDVTLDDLVVLCRKCHERVHEALEIGRTFVKRWEDRGPEYVWKATNRVFRWLRLIENKGLDKRILSHAGNPHFTAALGLYVKYLEKGRSVVFEEIMKEAELRSVECERKKVIAAEGQLCLNPLRAPILSARRGACAPDI